MLGSAGPVPSAQLVEEFNEALCAIAFDRANIPAGRKVVRVLCCTAFCCVLTCALACRTVTDMPTAFFVTRFLHAALWLLSCQILGLEVVALHPKL